MPLMILMAMMILTALFNKDVGCSAISTDDNRQRDSSDSNNNKVEENSTDGGIVENIDGHRTEDERYDAKNDDEEDDDEFDEEQRFDRNQGDDGSKIISNELPEQLDGKYRRISATQDLLLEDINEIQSRGIHQKLGMICDHNFVVYSDKKKF
ncbi:hypothetical protein QR98_0100630 [Sarcoptes scabiei]|uniref:Uncharacterized protein n=1 Tax=Sarcoptes scabiei TaxID=52283 RepID=A0A132AKF5_SARSC|nr:hypothetical protein QR98_0100630 [Sarcoptes scabiei]